MATDLSLLIGMVMLTMVCGGMASASAKGALSRNGAIGVRTKATTSSDAAWDTGHRAAAPIMRWGSRFGMLMTVVTVVVVIIVRPGEDPGWELVVPGVGFLGVVVGICWSGFVANRAAKAVE